MLRVAFGVAARRAMSCSPAKTGPIPRLRPAGRRWRHSAAARCALASFSGARWPPVAGLALLHFAALTGCGTAGQAGHTCVARAFRCAATRTAVASGCGAVSRTRCRGADPLLLAQQKFVEFAQAGLQFGIQFVGTLGAIQRHPLVEG